jgi:uncharacterized tellurite resistance protein B-like protein
MNFTDFITNHGKRIQREHYIHLVQVARIDGKIDRSELEFLHKEGKKFGLTDPEIDQLIKSEGQHHYTPPYSLKEKFDELYNIAEMIMADDIITEGERRMINRYAIAAGFSDSAIDKLIPLLFDGVKKGEDEEKLLNEFKKRHLFK